MYVLVTKLLKDMDEESSAVLHFEDVLPKTGWGLYYKFMLAMAFASYFANATSFLCIPVAIPLSTCESEISSSILYAILMSFFSGRSIGAFIGNSFCDIFGRKRLLTHSFIVNFVTTFMSAFAYNYYMIIFAVFFLGSSLEHQQTVVKIHLAEILPMKKRGHYLALCDFFWTLGLLQVSIIIYFFGSPIFVEHRVLDMRVTTWRMLFAISGGLNLVLACASALLEESPRYFLHARKEYLALLTLKQFFAINKSSYGNSFDVKEDNISHLVVDYGLFYQANNTGFIWSAVDIIMVMWKTIKLLFLSPFLKITLSLVIIKGVLLMIGLVNVNILLAKLVTIDAIRSGLDIFYLYSLKGKTMCPTFKDSKLYYSFIIISTNIALGQLLMVWVLDRVGRKIPLIISMIICGFSFLTLYFVQDNMTKMIISSLLIFSLSIAMTSISVVNIELFPTALRGTSHSITNFLGIVIPTIMIAFYQLYSKWFLIIMGSLFLAVTGANYFLEDLKQKPMVE